MALTLDALNAASAEDFTAALAEVFEHAPWVAAHAAAARPFPTVAALHAAMFAAVEGAPRDVQAQFLRGHPELSGAAARQGAMAAFSVAEQASLGLAGWDDAGFAAMNRDYRARFGIPFIICVRHHGRASLMREFTRRLGGTPDGEHAAALREVFGITELRIAGLVAGPRSGPAVDGHQPAPATVAAHPALGGAAAPGGLPGEHALSPGPAASVAESRADAPRTGQVAPLQHWSC